MVLGGKAERTKAQAEPGGRGCHADTSRGAPKDRGASQAGKMSDAVLRTERWQGGCAQPFWLSSARVGLYLESVSCGGGEVFGDLPQRRARNTPWNAFPSALGRKADLK